jgi:inner membrane protein involved in colicin E2 resistance
VFDKDLGLLAKTKIQFEIVDDSSEFSGSTSIQVVPAATQSGVSLRAN